MPTEPTAPTPPTPAPGEPAPGEPEPVRRVPTPPTEPPFDDDTDPPAAPRPVRVTPDRVPGRRRITRLDPAAARGRPTTVTAPTQGTLALAFVLPGGLPTVATAPPELRLVSPPVSEPETDAPPLADDVDFGPQPTRSAALPDPRPWAARFAQALVEVLAGQRPVGQLVRWTSGEIYESLATDLGAAGPAPGRAVSRQPAERPVVRSVRIDQPADGVAEVSAVVRADGRARAVALRLEGLDGRWQCTALRLG